MFVLVLIAYVISAAGLVLGGYIAVTSRVPRPLSRPSQAISDRLRVRFQGFALAAIGVFALVCAMAADMWTRNTLSPSWGLLVWAAFILAMGSVAFLSRRGTSRLLAGVLKRKIAA
jgi:hypothetical protein